jgi:hypothetical protein
MSLVQRRQRLGGIPQLLPSGRSLIDVGGFLDNSCFAVIVEISHILPLMQESWENSTVRVLGCPTPPYLTH